MHTPGKTWLPVGLMIAIAISVAPGSAKADKRRIVLMEIDGSVRTSKLKREVRRILRKEHTVVPEKVYRRAANRRRATKLNPSNIRKVCRDLGCDGIVDGVIEAEDGGYVFIMRLREGTTGKIKKRVAMRLRKPRLSRRMKKGLRKRLLAAIDRLDPVDERSRRGGGFEDDVADFGDDKFGDEFGDELGDEPRRRVARPSRVRTRQREERGEETAAPKEDPFGDEENPLADDDGGSNEAGFVAGSGTDGAVADSLMDDINKADDREFPVSIVAGVSVTKRDLRFAYSNSLQGGNAPTTYKGSPAPGVYIRGELYPMAFANSKNAFLKNIGFGFTVDRVLGLKVATQQNGMVVQGSAVQQRAEGELRYRYNFGEKATYPTLTATVGYGQMQFVIDDQLQVGVPDVQYQYLNPGLNLRIPFGDSVAMELGGKFLAIFNAGQIQLEDQYGAARTTGVDGDLFLEVKFMENFLARAGAHVTFIGFDFDGTGARSRTTGADQTGMTQTVGGAADLYLGGYASLGYQY